MKRSENLANLGTIGSQGEDVAARYLENKKFAIFDRNVRTKWGEIDIVAHRNGTLYFFEVKSVECRAESLVYIRRPEERVDEHKRLKLQRVVRSYLYDKYGTEEREFEFGVISVAFVPETKKAFVRAIREVL